MRVVDAVLLDHVSIRIHDKLVGLAPNAQESCIFKVDTRLRTTNEKAYEPIMVAIGPYHRGKDNLRQMEEHKLRYLQQLLERRNESSVKRYIDALIKLEERARRFYSERHHLPLTDEFIEMLLLDGCFIIELLRKLLDKYERDQFDPIFRVDWWLSMLWRDLVLFENQLPLFVLTELIEMTEAPVEKDNLIFIFMSYSRFIILPCEGRSDLFALAHDIGNQVDAQNIGHLLTLAHKSITPPYVKISTGGNDVDKEEWNSIPSATELQEAGVKFKKLYRGGSFFDIRFNNGVMEIPPLQIVDTTESIFRNLIAYEQYSGNIYPKYVTDYVAFMSYLINSPKNVELLRRRRIIYNELGDDEAVSTMFNKLGHCVRVNNSCYAEICRDVNKHCRSRRTVRIVKLNAWMAKLWDNYFDSPWALISFLAATFLLLLTLTQTIFSVLSYNNVPKT